MPTQRSFNYTLLIWPLYTEFDLRPSRFFYVNVHLEKYYVCTLKPEDESRDTESILYEDIFDLYGSRSDSAENNAMSLTNFVNKYE